MTGVFSLALDWQRQTSAKRSLHAGDGLDGCFVIELVQRLERQRFHDVRIKEIVKGHAELQAVAKWSVATLTYPTQDPTISVTESGGNINIGPLLTNQSGGHYNGLVSATSVDFSGANAYVQAVAVPATNTAAGAFFSVAVDASNLYRIFIESGWQRASAPRELAPGAMWMELRAGTYSSEVNPPGTVSFDNFRLAKP